MEQDTGTVTVALGIFSGRENPEFSLDAPATDQFAALVASAINGERSRPPPNPQLGKFYGFHITVPPDTAKRLGIPADFTLFQGVLSLSEGLQQLHWRDTRGIEKFLLDLALRQGFGELLKKAGIPQE